MFTTGGLNVEHGTIFLDVNGDFGMEILNIYDFTLGMIHMAPFRSFRLFLQLRTVAGGLVAYEPEAVFRRFDFSRPELGMRIPEERTSITDLDDAGTVIELHEYRMSCSKKRDDKIVFRFVDSDNVAVRKKFCLIFRGCFRIESFLLLDHFREKHEKCKKITLINAERRREI